MTVSPNPTPDGRVTPRHKSALLWGAVGALFFLVLHQGYLLLDGAFLGVGPVAAVAVAVFAATTVASYYTSGHLDMFEPDAPEADEPESAQAEPEPEQAELKSTETEPEPGRSEPEAGTDAVREGDGEQDDDESDWIWGGQSDESQDGSE